jgi:hypothetical protein
MCFFVFGDGVSGKPAIGLINNGSDGIVDDDTTFLSDVSNTVGDEYTVPNGSDYNLLKLPELIEQKKYTSAMIYNTSVYQNSTETTPFKFIADIVVIYTIDGSKMYGCDLLFDLDDIPAKFISKHFVQSYNIGGTLHMLCDENGCMLYDIQCQSYPIF